MDSLNKLIAIIFLLFSLNGFAQIRIITSKTDNINANKIDQALTTIITSKPDTISYWSSKSVVGLDVSEMAFVNWSAGGTSAISGLVRGQFKWDYKDDNQVWATELICRYGMNKQEGIEVRKTEDVLRLNSTYGYRTNPTSNWYHSGKLNFNTQFTDGYKYPNTTDPISRPFAPAYVFLGVGSEYINKPEKLNAYLSPLTLKSTMVLDQKLANAGAYGVQKAVYDASGNLISKGKKSKTELGILATSYLEREIINNVILKNRLTLYTDYLHNFGNIDVDWQLYADLKVNDYIKSNIGLNLVYDEDIDVIKEENGVKINEGSKVQLKQILGIGFEYVF
ncbi:DUF3078 domain-containing protein [Flavobacterium gilvum]|uniref:DUF3078 domain-containing protein n=1 Tax=Flavobacterium gilvum TaxID=1492737 RepID=A0AAC9I209_9FLAO|nr:DUF3078 domain-containing protein [Flavobacterium gilvum]AOW09084.1 hypothetical protein EM308_05945 [Flavobacterium gilvum]KFC60640.1 hypothetical protein FEM08_06820 [Flavobacterium gilvum]